MVVGGLAAKSCPTLSTPGTIAHQAPLFTGFSRQEYQSGLPFSLKQILTEYSCSRYRGKFLISKTSTYDGQSLLSYHSNYNTCEG